MRTIEKMQKGKQERREREAKKKTKNKWNGNKGDCWAEWRSKRKVLQNLMLSRSLETQLSPCPESLPTCVLTQESPQLTLVLVCESLKRVTGPIGFCTDKAEKVSAGVYTSVSRGQVMGQEVQTHTRLARTCEIKAQS